MPAELAHTGLSVVEANTRTAAIRADLTDAVTGIRQAITAGVPEALGYPTAWAWVEAELGDLLLQLRLPRDVRLQLVDAMGDLPVRAIADRLGVSVGTVQNDRHRLGLVVPIRTELPAPTGRVWEQAAEWLNRHPRGLTLVELAEVAGWTEGKASGALSDVRRRGLAVRSETRRDGQRVHLPRV